MGALGLLLPLLLASAPTPESTDELLALLPRNTAGFVLVPNLERASDDLAATLKGMDRAGLLFGGDPLDQLVSALGVPLQIDSQGAAIIAWVLPDAAAPVPSHDGPSAGDSSASPDSTTSPDEELSADASRSGPRVVAFIPSKDPQQFLDLNFEVTDSAGAFRHESGTIVHGRALPTHAALSLAPLPELAPIGVEDVDAFRARWPAEAVELFRSGDVVLAGNASAIEGAVRELMTILGRTPLGRALMPEEAGRKDRGLIARVMQAIAASSAGGVTAIDFDPLAIVFRSTAQLRDVQPLDPSRRPRDGLSALPDRPYHLALSMNLMPLHRLATLRSSIPFLGGDDEHWLDLVQSVNFAAYESRTGLRGGLFNDAALILTSDRPGELRDLIRRKIKAVPTSDEGLERRVTWLDDRPVEGIGNVDVFEINLTRVPDNRLHEQMIERLVFGPVGVNGYVHRSDRGVIITFSQRPDVLRRVAQSIKSGQSLADDPIITAMRQWMADDPDVEWYVDLGSLMEMLRDAVEFYPILPALPRYEIQGELPPIGFSASVHDARLDSTAIVPSAVAAIIFDQLAKMISMGRGQAEP